MTRFLTANATMGPADMRVLIRPEVWDDLDGAYVDTGSGVTEWDRMVSNIGRGNIVLSSNGLSAPAGSPLKSKALLTTTARGVPPIWVGIWGGVDVIRDPYTLAGSGQVKLTGLLTADVQISRAVQLEVLTDIQ